jgi:hypothetical protein
MGLKDENNVSNEWCYFAKILGFELCEFSDATTLMR